MEQGCEKGPYTNLPIHNRRCTGSLHVSSFGHRNSHTLNDRAGTDDLGVGEVASVGRDHLASRGARGCSTESVFVWCLESLAADCQILTVGEGKHGNE